MKQRTAQIKRKTSETDVELTLNLDGKGNSEISTGVGFLDHMLDLFTRHALIDLTLRASGDQQVDDHHTVEDVGICLGQALKDALGDKKGITRFASVSVPMQESLANVAIDISGRAALVYNVNFNTERIGNFDASLVREFFEAFSANASINLHVNVPYGTNAHHIVEAIFKGFAKAFYSAIRVDERMEGVPSTKGIM